MSNRKQKIIFDYSQCRFRDFDKKCTRFNTTRKYLFVESVPFDKIIFAFDFNNKAKWLPFTADFDYNKDLSIWYYCHTLMIKARTKKALLRKIRQLKFPKGFILSVDPGVFVDTPDDCTFKVKIKSEPE